MTGVRVLAIDPGSEQSAFVVFVDGLPLEFAIVPNDEMLAYIKYAAADTLAVEAIASYGMAVGADIFETCVWVGRLIQRWKDTHTGPVRRVYRRDVKLHLCGSARAKDANVRQALIDLYGPGKDRAVGLKASPGPLYGVKGQRSPSP